MCFGSLCHEKYIRAAAKMCCCSMLIFTAFFKILGAGFLFVCVLLVGGLLVYYCSNVSFLGLEVINNKRWKVAMDISFTDFVTHTHTHTYQ
jgi:hypothetical protein